MLAKVVILSAVLAAVHATGTFVSTGVSTTTRRQDSNGNYGFSYEIVDANGASNSRSEIGDAHGNKQGNYHLIDTDGRARRVDYIADQGGFRAVVKTNEPGTAKSAPAGAVIDSPYQGPVAPEVPVVAQPTVVVAEPVAHPAPVVQEPISHPAPVIQEPVAHPAPVVLPPAQVIVHPVPNPVSSTFTITHAVPVVQQQVVAVPTRGIIVNNGLYGFGLHGLRSGIISYNSLKGYPLIR
ncbi:adult-specific rigid cuticular protein 15.5 [Trichonephila inaurata madagascariensis]|uniref:Adult-specific rigid cuticular protein 15.5 n=1 Tax=Trichonephila inaurata madagascariensis TaxID=2747483 RepID=A0A8X6IM85_9ARAC|nr:adult-specific rigid cuticular protein 15.5 [Trichonephila inaurata madagascariensis]GFY80095.1 adult-specific rigid cuticular protein 15.5 [Trichonephila inaurata madagascariensis]